jgi:aminopeptidase 2
VLNEYRTADTSDERNDALRTLGRAPAALIPRVLELPLSEEVKTQDIYLPLASLRSSAVGIEGLWGWLTKNWDTLEKKLPPGLSMLSTVVMICSAGFTQKGHLDQIKQFFEGKDTKGYEMSLAQSIDGVTAKSFWVERDGQNVKEWLVKSGFLS